MCLEIVADRVGRGVIKPVRQSTWRCGWLERERAKTVVPKRAGAGYHTDLLLRSVVLMKKMIVMMMMMMMMMMK